MADQRTRLYEGMFLFPQSAAGDLRNAVDYMRETIEREGGEIVSFSKWDERRLAYEIKGNKRGIYFLAHFKAPAEKLVDLERDFNLSERLLRFMILRADHLTDDEAKTADASQQLEDELRLREERATTADETSIENATETEAVAAGESV